MKLFLPGLESIIFSAADIYYKFKEWESSKNGKLFIAGYTGSGKSTYAKAIASKYNVLYIELDNYIERDSDYIDELYKQHKIQELQKYLDDTTIKTFDKIFKMKEKMVVDGMQVIIYPDINVFKSHSVVVKNTSLLVSFFRALKRNRKEEWAEGWSWLELASNIYHNLYAQRIEQFIKIVKQWNVASPFCFYHLINKDTKLDKDGLLSLQAMYDKKLFDMFDEAAAKYTHRIVYEWKIYPDKKPEELTREEILAALIKFRSKYGTRYIYMFRYPPTKALGKNMAKVLATKDIYKVDFDNPEFKKSIVKIGWGHVMSHSDNEELTEEYYRSVTEKEYFKNYNDNGTPLFASINHIGIVTKSGTIPLKYLTRV